MKLLAPLLVTLIACKSHDAREAERAAQRVRAKSVDLKHEKLELADEAREAAAELRDELGDVAEANAEVQRALADFEQKRAARINNLQGQLAVHAQLPAMILTMARSAPLTAGERVALDEKLQILRVRIDEAHALLQQLPTTAAATWTARDDEITRALQRIDDAREDAIEIVEDAQDEAPRTKS